MDRIRGIQRAIDYVEANLTEKIDVEEVAEKAYSSSFHFQRVFSVMCGFSIGDYVRMRRLSLAGEEFSKGNAGIIDVALKYGYDTPESFSRAFTRFHGVSPSEAKRGGKVRILTPLSVKLILTGGSKLTGIRGIRALQCRTRKTICLSKVRSMFSTIKPLIIDL